MRDGPTPVRSPRPPTYTGTNASWPTTASTSPPARSTHVLKAVAISTAVVLAVLAGTVFLTYRHLEGNISVSGAFDQITQPRPEEVEVGRPEEAAQRPHPGLRHPRGADRTCAAARRACRTPRSCCTCRPTGTRAYGVSIPRDLMVPRPACKKTNGDTDPGGVAGPVERRLRRSAARPAPSRSSRRCRTSGSTTSSSWTSTASRTWSTRSAASRSACRRRSTTRSGGSTSRRAATR